MACILIIDDEPEILSLFAEALSEAGHTVHAASNGVEGLAMAEAVSPQAVLVDVFMPEMDGIETILNLRKAYPQTKVIAISGGGMSHNFKFLETSPEMGADMMLRKPILPDQLVVCVHNCLEMK
jgi:CheY-like chemotaxis protein